MHVFARADNGPAVGAKSTPNPRRQPLFRSHTDDMMTRTGACCRDVSRVVYESVYIAVCTSTPEIARRTCDNLRLKGTDHSRQVAL
jgi:hypothetical protein